MRGEGAAYRLPDKRPGDDKCPAMSNGNGDGNGKDGRDGEGNGQSQGVGKMDLPPMPRPKPLPVQKRILIQRNPVPSTNQMVADAYHTLASQLRHFKSFGDREKFDVREATAFNKLVTSVASLQELERKNAAMLELGKLSPDEMAALLQQAKAHLPDSEG